jgi:hypothetical protein
MVGKYCVIDCEDNDDDFFVKDEFATLLAMTGDTWTVYRAFKGEFDV